MKDKIIQGDCLEVLKTMMNRLNLIIKRFSKLDNFRLHWSFSRRTTKPRFFAFFTLAKFEDKFCLSVLNKKVGNKFFDYFTCQFIRRLVAIKRFFRKFGTTSLFSIIISTESFFEQFNRWLVNHSDLDSFVVLRINAVSSIVSFLYSNISFPIKQSSKVSINYFHTSLIPQLVGEVKGGGGL